MVARKGPEDSQVFYNADARRGSAKLAYAILKAQGIAFPRRATLTRRRRRPRGAEIRTSHPQVDRIIAKTARCFGSTREEILGRSKAAEIVWPRQVAIYLALEKGFSSPAVGRFFGRDHSTCLHAWRKVHGLLEVVSEIQRLREELL